MFDDRVVFIDAGHGGIDLSGNYVTAPSKQHEHAFGTFHNGRYFYEGVWNRLMTDLVCRKLDLLGIRYIPLHHDYLDLSLPYRVDKANWYHRNYKQGILFSTHANASGTHRARGYEIYTSPGVTQSDRIAEIHWNETKELLGARIIMRSDTSDGDHDKEARFYIIQQSIMPAILIEHLFFDNIADAVLLMDDEIQDLFAEAQVRTIVKYFREIS